MVPRLDSKRERWSDEYFRLMWEWRDYMQDVLFPTHKGIITLDEAREAAQNIYSEKFAVFCALRKLKRRETTNGDTSS